MNVCYSIANQIFDEWYALAISTTNLRKENYVTKAVEQVREWLIECPDVFARSYSSEMSILLVSLYGIVPLDGSSEPVLKRGSRLEVERGESSGCVQTSSGLAIRF